MNVRLSRKRLVRIHLEGATESVEGILLGRSRGHYVLLAASLVAGEDQTYKLDGPHILVPRERVLFVQVRQ